MSEMWPALPDWFWYPVVFVYGAIVGSFLNVVIYRLPLGMHLSKPPSTCPQPGCGYKLGFWDNIPLVSFLLLGARCRLCRKPISWRYFCVELFTACVWTLLYHRVSGYSSITWIDFVGQALFVSVLIALVFIDLDHFLAPDSLNLTAGMIAIVRDICCLSVAFYTISAWPETREQFLYFGWLPRALVGALAYGGTLFLVSVVGFVYYAREENESVGAVFVRYFREHFGPGEVVGGEIVGGEGKSSEAEASPAPETVSEATPQHPTPDAQPPTPIEDGDTGMDEAEVDETDPPRLRFSPAFLCALAAAAMFPMLGFWALILFFGPWAIFATLAPKSADGAVGSPVSRFFSADDLGLPELESDVSREAAEAADDFAREAETGAAGAMGFGDVLLALAIGALLGPGLALLSLMFATFLGAITGITMARLHGKSLRTGVPFVPFMAAGAILTLLYGNDLVRWYGTFLNPTAAATPTPWERPRRPNRQNPPGSPPQVSPRR